MKFLFCLTLVLAYACTVTVAKHQADQADQNQLSISRENGDIFNRGSSKSTINSGADTLTGAVDLVAPLVRDATALGSDLVARIINAGSDSNEDRIYDPKLLERVDTLIADISRAYKVVKATKSVARIAEKVGAAANLISKAVSSAKSASSLLSAARAIYAKYEVHEATGDEI